MRLCRCHKKVKIIYKRQTSTSPDIQGSTSNIFDNKLEKSYNKRKKSKTISNRLHALAQEVSNEKKRDNIDPLDAMLNDDFDLNVPVKVNSPDLKGNGNPNINTKEENGNNNLPRIDILSDNNVQKETGRLSPLLTKFTEINLNGNTVNNGNIITETNND